MPDSMAATPLGTVLIANGIDKMLVFRPSLGTLETAGVIAPTIPLTLSGTGSGNIVGSFYAYARFVDRDGQFSSLTPVSNNYEAQATVATVSGATNASPIVITTSAAHGLGDGQVVKIKDVMGNTAANGIYAVSVLTTTTFELWTDSSFSVPVAGNGTYNSDGSVQTGVSTIVYGNLPVSTESKVVRRQILRNKDGSAKVFYVDIDTTDLTSTQLVSYLTSADLLESVTLLDVDGHSLVDKTRPPDFKKCLAHHLGRMFAYGNEIYSEGACVVTNGSAEVTGIGTEWGVTTFGGRFFEVSGGSKQYEISSCNSTTSLTLTEAYTGSTDPYAYYQIHPGDGERRALHWSEAGEPEAWPGTNTLSMEEDNGAGEATGLMSMGSYLYPLNENRIYRFSFVNNPLLDGFAVKAAKRGCINNRCWVQVEDSAYMLDRNGFHVFAHNDDRDIGDPQIQDIVRSNPSGKYRINWNASRYFHAAYDPGEGVIRWFICLGGQYTPRHAAALSVRNQRWWIEEYTHPIAASCLGRIGGKPQLFLGSDAKRIYSPGFSTLDGPDPRAGTVRGTATSAGVNWIADTAATFATAGLVGAPLVITQGKGKGQVRRIYSVSGTTIYVTEPWLDRPDTTSVYQIGGISWRWRSGWNRWVDGDDQQVRAVSVQSKPLSAQAGQTLRLYADLATAATAGGRVQTLNEGNGLALLQADKDAGFTGDMSIDCTKSNGFVIHRLPGFRVPYSDSQRFISVEVSGVTNQEQQCLFRIQVDGAQ